MAFQIADDLFDYTLATPGLGKEIGADLREGKLTLPVIHALGKADAAEREWIAALIRSRSFSEEDFRRLIARLHATGAVAYCEAVAAGYIEKAKAALAGFPDSPARATMLDIADYALRRQV
jgi:octaprenyl-diphosphate synthase